MITEAIEHISPSLQAELAGYLVAAPPDACACPEHDPRWLHVLHESMRHRPLVLIARAETKDLVRMNDPGSPESLDSLDSRESLDSLDSLDAPSGQTAAPNAGDIVGYLPLCLVASRLFGRFLVSLPYLNRAGIVAQSPQIATALIDQAVTHAQRLNVEYLELRHHQTFPDHPSLPVQRDEKVRMVLELPADTEGLWKTIGPKVRNLVRKAEKGDQGELAIQWGSLELLNDFYDVFAVNMRDLGTPVYPKRLFASILTHFKDVAELAVVTCAGVPAAGALLIHDNGTPNRASSTQVPSASCLRRFNSTNANMWMYHNLLLRSMERGSREFDFGRSSEGSGTYRFKKQWGAMPQPTVWQYHVRRGDIGAMRPDSPKNRRRVETWQKLPVWITRLAGPMIVRGIP